MGTIFLPLWPSELFDGLYFDYVKSASNAPFECFRGKIKGATENGNFLL